MSLPRITRLTCELLGRQAAESRLKQRLKDPKPGKSKIKEEYGDLEGNRLVCKRLTGMVFVFGGETNLALGPCLVNSNLVVNFINNSRIQW